MNPLAKGRLDVEIRRHRATLKTWVHQRIANTPTKSNDERDAAIWFAELDVNQRHQLVTDLARLNVEGVDLFAIVTGPLGVLFTKFACLFQGEVHDRKETTADSDLSDHESDVPAEKIELATSDTAWFDGWNDFERVIHAVPAS